MLEIILIIYFSKRIGQKARDKGRSANSFEFLFYSLWISGEIIGFFIGAHLTNGLLIYLYAESGAAVGAISSFLIVYNLKEELNSKELPRPFAIAENFFTTEEKQKIKLAIQDAEKDTSGEIRVHIENKCKDDVLDRAAFLFGKLKMHKTVRRNGVLFYLSVFDKKFGIIGDAGINAVTPDDFWDQIKETMQTLFRNNEFADGLILGIHMAGKALKKYFPYMENDVNELSDEISFGKK